MFTESDKQLMQHKGIDMPLIEKQLNRFNTGFPWLKIQAVATVGNGIKRMDDDETAQCVNTWKTFQQQGGSILKFVPASGAASRMFKNIFAFISSGRDLAETDFEKQFIAGIDKFAFYHDLNKVCMALYGHDIRTLVAAGKHVLVAKALLEPSGLNYGALPKGLLKFHMAASNAHTPVEEHLEEAAQYAAMSNHQANIHFTVSPEHRNEFTKLLRKRTGLLEDVWGVKFNVTMSEQKTATDTIAVNTDNTPYREPDGSLLFRPAGHGALIENLNDQDADVVFVKNIDNVVPSKLRHTTIKYKKVIGGYLIMLQSKIAQYLTALEDKVNDDMLKEMLDFTQNTLNIHCDEAEKMTSKKLADFLRNKFNRPIRVCGMVRNEGEPGGGPYLAFNSDGTVSPQILEEAQINKEDPEALEMMKSGTHFNPVDLVCYIKDYKGNKFNLKDYVDENTGLISMKSKNGVDIKALELPGLWNGAMSDWNTAFVEVPIQTFNPVKTVNDLLRPAHQ